MINSIYTDTAKTLEAVNNAFSIYNTVIIDAAIQNVDASQAGMPQILVIDFTAKSITMYYNPKGTMPASGLIPTANLNQYYFTSKTMTLS